MAADSKSGGDRMVRAIGAAKYGRGVHARLDRFHLSRSTRGDTLRAWGGGVASHCQHVFLT